MLYLVIFESIFLVFVVYFLFLMVFLKLSSLVEVMSSYECGFDINSLARIVFSYRFFLLAILFIIFDVEISLMLPVPYLMVSYMGVIVFCLFMFILLLGLMYEYFFGSLDWLHFYMSKE
uniref:NADH-ubiquinone oxidoreductase chain 3 n=1 Tax=Oxyopes sertatus TaxID=93706 RepID=A0A0U1XEQ7_OXYSE|nr:NADH dehydrogenase subunit 3 [Oxyopes sertatus]AIP86899.1 NADH dehydrogenase subunit 3 [Oxyopes sertatus]